MMLKYFIQIISVPALVFLSCGLALATEYPDGEITIYNASNNTVTAQVSSSSFGKFTLAAKEQKNVSYSSLVQVCSSSPTACTAYFYVNNAPAGSATINAVNGKLVSQNLSIPVSIAKNNKVLRRVIIK